VRFGRFLDAEPAEVRQRLRDLVCEQLEERPVDRDADVGIVGDL
jgi:hypothetical protein